MFLFEIISRRRIIIDLRMINKLPSGLIQDVSSSEAFVVGDQKVCTLSTESFLALQQTFWNTNNGGIRLNHIQFAGFKMA